ncbi:hypothetical protein Tsubulata_045033 [Turnera subulata]|uniref:Late embryogenesis abundant protein D-29 n=1 Tax=Turnera subulata TaxID=218843 RepID=A0A9Q0FGS8_9ROSI|nr:hypothetical protein Tsubulata_045033 [Turnera subulata]
MEKKVLTMMVVVAVLWADQVGWCLGDDSNGQGTVEMAREGVNLAAENARGKGEAMKLRAEEAMQGAKESRQSWRNWAREKIGGVAGTGQEGTGKQTAQEIIGKTGEAASIATNTMNTAAQDSSRFASEKVGEVAHKAFEKAADACDGGKQKLDEASEKLAEIVHEAEEKLMGEVMGHGSGSALDAFNEAYYMASDAAYGARERMDAAAIMGRDKASYAYNHLGDAMEQGREEAQRKSSSVSDWASRKVDGARDRIADAMQYGEEGAEYVYDQATEKVNKGFGVATDKANQAKERMGFDRNGGGSSSSDQETMNAYEAAMDRVGEAYVTARESTTQQTKGSYEAAKEKMSQATGDVGARIREVVAAEN